MSWSFCSQSRLMLMTHSQETCTKTCTSFCKFFRSNFGAYSCKVRLLSPMCICYLQVKQLYVTGLPGHYDVLTNFFALFFHNWWRGVVGNTFRLKRSYSTPGLVSTAMSDCLWAGKPSRCEACQLGRLSLLLSAGR